MAGTTHQIHSVRIAATLRRLATAWILGLGLVPVLDAAVLYWDNNSFVTGAGTTPTAVWSTSGFANRKWSTSANGTSGTANFTSGSDAVFSAGTDATGAYTVTVSGTQNVSSITVQDGTPTFSAGTVNFNDATPDLIINSGRTLTFNSALTSSSSGGLRLSGGGTLSLGSTTSLTGTLDLGVSGTAGTTLRLNGVNLTVGTLNITSDSTIDFSGTAATLSVTNLSISAGVTLTIQNWASATDYFYATNWSGATLDLMGSAPMNQVIFNGFTANETGWDSWDKRIRPNVPEPSTYGAILLGSLTGFALWRRRHRPRH
jgi:hypothetical protein